MLFAMPSCSASALTAGPKPWSRSTTGSSSNERSRSERIVCALLLERRAEHLLRLVGAVRLDRVDDAVEHERDPRHRLHRPVVEEEREPATLLLLGRDQLVGEPRVLGLEPLYLLYHPLVLMALGEEQRGGAPRP